MTQQDSRKEHKQANEGEPQQVQLAAGAEQVVVGAVESTAVSRRERM